MATKTISLEISAYEKLAKARLHEKESFSQVVMRGTWNHGTFSGRQLLNFLSDHKQKGAVLSEEDLDALEAAQIDPRVSDSKWNS